MAQRVQVLLVDDKTGGPADENIRFAIDGVTYEIDLSAANAEALRAEFAPWIGHARKVNTTRRTAGKPKAKGRGTATPMSAPPASPKLVVNLSEVRTWANDNGFKVSARGQIKGEVMDAYRAAHPTHEISRAS